MVDRNAACGCTDDHPSVRPKNNVPGARSWETPEQTEERKWIAYLMRRYPRSVTLTEKVVLDHLYAITSETRWTCEKIASEYFLNSGKAVHKIEADVLEKIGYDRVLRKERPDERRRA